MKKILFLFFFLPISTLFLFSGVFGNDNKSDWDVDDQKIAKDKKNANALSYREGLFMSGGFGFGSTTSDYEIKYYDLVDKTYKNSTSYTGMFIDINLGYCVNHYFQLISGIKGPGFFNTEKYVDNNQFWWANGYPERDNYMVFYAGFNLFFSNTYPSLYLSFGAGIPLSNEGYMVYEGLGIEILDFLSIEFNFMQGSVVPESRVNDNITSFNVLLRFFWYLY